MASPIAQCPKGHFYIEASSSCIPNVRIAIDRVPVSMFHGDNVPYIRIEEAIKWHEKNPGHEPPGEEPLAALFTQLLERLKSGDGVVAE